MKLSAILSVATFLPLVLAIATPQTTSTENQCYIDKCQPMDEELSKCTDRSGSSESVMKDCFCNNAVINSNFDACLACGQQQDVINTIRGAYQGYCGRLPGTSSKTRAGYFMLGGMAAAAGVAAIL